MSDIFLIWKSREQRRLMLLLLLVHLAVALPFKSMVLLPGFTEIRPVAGLTPIFGLFFGPAGAWAFAVGNLIGDIVSDSLAISSIGGFLGNFFAVYLYPLLWKKLTKRSFSLRCGKDLLYYVLITLISVLATIALIIPWIVVFLPQISWSNLAMIILINNSAFALMPGLGIIIIMQTQFKVRDHLSRS